ncbi:MAG: riboflavin synthase [Phycisphaerae bacterium]
MFTGIIEAVGSVCSLRRSGEAARLSVDAGRLSEAPRRGASIAVNGVCQTVAADSFPILEFDVVPETLRCTTIGRLRTGDPVNLEPSLKAGDRLDGHIVQGHVDGIAIVTEVVTAGRDRLVWFELQDESLADFVIPKGSVAIDGVSLTIARRSDETPIRFAVALIPTTLERTNLGTRQPGDAVNIETDVIARAVISYLRRVGQPLERPVSLDFLHEHGFA